MCQAWFVFKAHPQLEVMNRPAPIDGKEQWKPRNLTNDNWQFKIKPNAGDLKFEDLRYATWATDSYGTFKKLRDRGRIASGIRFQVSLPIPIVACGEFFGPDDVARVDKPYAAAMLDEVRKICEAIPHNDLTIIHDWDDPHSIAILQTCRRAMVPGSKLLLIETLLPSANERRRDALLGDVLMMVVTGGRERTAAEYRVLLETAQLNLVRILPTAGAFSVLEAEPSV